MSKRELVSMLYERKWISFFLFFIFFGIVGILLHLFMPMIFQKDTFDWRFYFGIALSFYGCLIGVFVLEKIEVTSAVDLNGFFELAIELLNKSVSNDEVTFLLPTFYIGGSEARYAKMHKKYSDLLLRKAADGVKMKMYVLSHDYSLDDQYLASSESDKVALLKRDDFVKDLLVEFHEDIYSQQLSSVRNKPQYFDGFFDFSKQLKNINNVTIIDLKGSYKNIGIIAILNMNKHKLLFGTYSVNKGINTTAELIRNNGVALGAHEMIKGFIVLHI
jgi:hypothetical protein